MNHELVEQQRVSTALRQQLESLEEERKTITERIRVVEAKLEVQDLRGKLEVKKRLVSELREKLKELEGKMKAQELSMVGEHVKIGLQQEEPSPQRHFF